MTTAERIQEGRHEQQEGVADSIVCIQHLISLVDDENINVSFDALFVFI